MMGNGLEQQELPKTAPETSVSPEVAEVEPQVEETPKIKEPISEMPEIPTEEAVAAQEPTSSSKEDVAGAEKQLTDNIHGQLSKTKTSADIVTLGKMLKEYRDTYGQNPKS